VLYCVCPNEASRKQTELIVNASGTSVQFTGGFNAWVERVFPQAAMARKRVEAT
jgi:hypothetical protein